MSIKTKTALQLAWVLILLSETVFTQTEISVKGSGTYEKRLPRPSWITREPVVYVGNWDDIPLFEIRRGGVPDNPEAGYYKEYTPETVKKLKDLGVTMAIIPFYKAFGIEAEKDNMEKSRLLASLLKKQGIRVGVYIGSTFAYETFLAEVPEAKDWMVPDFMGRPVTYGDQVFRKIVYFQHPGYKAYIKRVLRIAIEDLKVDLIHFDNPTYQGTRAVFFHPLAVEHFRSYLANKYTPDMLKKRFGFSDMRFIEPPRTDRPVRTIDDPLMQEWTDFRCRQLADYYGEMEEYIRGLNPEVAVENNPHGLSGLNSMWEQSIDFPRLLAHTDFFWTEGEETSLTREDVLISKIRTFKMASTLENRVFTYTSASKLEMAEAMAYNRQGMGMVGGLNAPDRLSEDQKKYIRFFHENFSLYRDVRNIADVAFLHSYASMAFNNDQPYISTFLYEQALIQAKIPFDIIFDDQLSNLAKYKVLILGDQECLSDEKLDLIRSYVRNGGGLIATGNTGYYTEWRRKRSYPGFDDLFPGKTSPESTTDDPAILRIPAGKGRAVHIPAVIPAIPKPPATAMTGRYWKLPVNYKEMVDAVRWAASDKISADIKAPLTVTMELVENTSQNSFILHLINFDHEKQSVRDIPVSISLRPGKKVSGVNLMTPDNRKNEVLTFMQNGERVDFSVPLLTLYDVVVIRLK